MTQETIQSSQRLAARIAGFTLLLLMISGFLSMFAFGVHQIVVGGAAASARNVLEHERGLRGQIVCGLVMLNCDVVLALALFALLKPVNSSLALLGSFWRVANATVLAAGVAAKLVSLDLWSNPKYTSLLPAEQLHGLAVIFLDVQSRLSFMGLIFFCLGAGIHSGLLLRSRYIPRIISGLYLFACAEMLLCCFVFVLFPSARAALDPAFIVPDFFAELAAGLWLAFKGASIPTSKA